MVQCLIPIILYIALYSLSNIQNYYKYKIDQREKKSPWSTVGAAVRNNQINADGTVEATRPDLSVSAGG